MENTLYALNWSSNDWILEKYNLYKAMLFRIAFSYLGNKHDSEDVLQEAFIKLHYSAPNFASYEDEKRWLIRVTINLCKDHLKSFWHRNKISLDDIEAFAVTTQDHEDLLEILKLHPKYKIVIHLYYMEGYRISEIAKILHISESAVKMRLKRGRELLKLEMEVNHEN
ncbi:MAG: RNA polymerase sigma factor [Mobilitalea sp.]